MKRLLGAAAAAIALACAASASAAVIYQGSLPAAGEDIPATLWATIPVGKEHLNQPMYLTIQGGTLVDVQLEANFYYHYIQYYPDEPVHNNGWVVPHCNSQGTATCNATAQIAGGQALAGATATISGNNATINFFIPAAFDNCATETILGKFCEMSPGSWGLSIVGYVALGDGPTTYILSDTPLGSAVPEPATWAIMIGGFGLAGVGLRRARQNPSQSRWSAGR